MAGKKKQSALLIFGFCGIIMGKDKKVHKDGEFDGEKEY